MGSVYLVQHLHTDQQLALKLLHATVVTDEVALTRFRREARATARVDSDHVVKVTDADVAPELGGVPFLVMEWLRGQSLEDLVTQRGPLPPEEVVTYMRQAARALDKAHAVGIVHRDLKPDNLFVTTREDGTPCLKILDFGIAKLTQGGDDPGRLKATGTGQVFGTPLYMSPEQIKAELDKICPRSDVWALGIVAHRLLLGVEPWTATTITGLVAQIAYEPIPVPSKAGATLGPAFDAWFARCCARDIDARYASAGDAVSALAKALDVAEEAGPVISRSGHDAPTSAAKRSAPRRDEIDRTAFSATSPNPVSSLPRPPALPREAPPPSKRSLVLGAAAICVAAAVASWAYVHRERPASLADAPTASATTLPRDHAVPAKDTPRTPATAPSTPDVTVAPVAASASAAAQTPTVKAAPSSPSTRKAPPSGATTPAPTPTPPAPPVATAPAKPDDPLGTRH